MIKVQKIFENSQSWLVLGILSYLVLITLQLSDVGGNTMSKIITNLPLTLTLVFHLLFFRSAFQQLHIFDVERIFNRAMKAGVSTFLVCLLPLGIAQVNISTKIVQLFEFVGLYAFLLFTLFLLFSYRKLTEVNEPDNALRFNWRIYLLVLGLAAFICLLPATAAIQPYIPITFSCLLMLPLIFKVKWIVSIGINTKWICILFLVILNFILLGLVQVLLSYNLSNLILLSPRENIFGLILITFLFTYSIFSMLALIFNLPVASLMEQRSFEIKNLQEISGSVLEGSTIEETLNLLFKKSFRDTSADAGWLNIEQLGNVDALERQIYYTDSINKEVVEFYLGIANLYKEEQNHNDKEDYYIPNIAKNTLKGKSEVYRSLLVLPIYSKENALGTVYLLKRVKVGFDAYDLEVAYGYAAQARLAFENFRLTEKAIKDSHAQQELKIARTAQRQLLPLQFPESSFFEMAAFSESAMEVGGDYYDFILLDKNRLTVIIADVAGSGTSAAFYMAHMKGVFQSLAQLNLPVATFLEFANTALSRCLEKHFFITLTYALFDFGKRKMLYGRAGHTPVLYYSIEEEVAYFLEDEGLGMGIIRDGSYSKYVKTYEQSFQEDDVFVFFTDGIIEMRSNDTGEQYGTERLIEIVNEHADTSAETIKKLILNDYNHFMESSSHADDHTLIVVKIR